MATPLENLQTAYANICQQLAEITASPKPNYTVSGVTVSWGEHFASLTERMEALRKVPGVAPDQSPVFEVHG